MSGCGNPRVRQGKGSTLFFMVNDKLTMQEREVHIGKLVKSVFDESGMSVAELARRLHCERPNVYSIFSRYNMDVGLLVSLSKVLKHNFLMIL